MFDPLQIAEAARSIVCRDSQRAYYRFRASRFYGGIATADCVGCCLRCVFCWSWKEVERPQDYGKLCTSDEVAGKLLAIARRKGWRQLRISGNEPTIARDHLLRVLELIPEDYAFILETNGILLGSDPGYVQALSKFSNLHVRVSLKGASEEEFARLSGAVPEGFGLQLEALRRLNACGVQAHPACMVSFSTEENLEALRRRLEAIESSYVDFEVEELILYPSVQARLERLNVGYTSAHRPDSIPPGQI